MKQTAIVLAGGRGKRMSSEVSKQYLPLGGVPMLIHALKCFETSEYIDEIILVLPGNEIEYVKTEILSGFKFTKLAHIVAGGAERYDSVLNALAMVDEGIVFIHDGARPFITEEILRGLTEAVRITGACATGVKVVDTIKRTDASDMIEETVDRSSLWQIQTPQVFELSLIKKAYEKFLEAGKPHVTDDTMVVELFGNTKVKMVEGSYENIKLTTPTDMIIAEEILKSRS